MNTCPLRDTQPAVHEPRTIAHAERRGTTPGRRGHESADQNNFTEKMIVFTRILLEL